MKKISFDKNAIFLDGGSTILVLLFDFAYYWEYSLIFLYVEIKLESAVHLNVSLER